MSSPRRLSIFFLLALFAMAAVCGAQTFRGGISGRIADPSGAMLPGSAPGIGSGEPRNVQLAAKILF